MTYPTSAEINALPAPLRRFICDLETRCDPAGDLRTIAALREQVTGLAADNERLRSRLEALEDEDA